MAVKKRFTIGLGFLFDYIFENSISALVKSIHEGSREEGLNFISFGGGGLAHLSPGITIKIKTRLLI